MVSFFLLNNTELWVWGCMPKITTIRKLNQKVCEFNASLSYTVRLSRNKKYWNGSLSHPTFIKLLYARCCHKHSAERKQLL